MDLTEELELLNYQRERARDQARKELSELRLKIAAYEQIIRDNNRVINELMGVVRDPSEVRAILFKTS